MNNIDYIKFVVSKVESGFLDSSNSREYVKVITVLHSLKMTDNLLKELYILSGIKKLRRLTSYFIFMLKKVESGSITLDNFMENYVTDKNYIYSYFQTYYDLEQITSEEFNSEEIDTKFIIEEDEEQGEAPVYKLAETTFKVEELDNELVTEEFRETTINENYELPGEGYLKLADGFVGGNLEGAEIKEMFFDDSEDVFSLPTSMVNTDIADTTDEPVNTTGVLSEESFFTNEDELSESADEKQKKLFEEVKKTKKNKDSKVVKIIEEGIEESKEIEEVEKTKEIKDTEEFNAGEDVEDTKEITNVEEVNSENLADFYEKLNNETVPEENSEDNTVFVETLVNIEDEQDQPAKTTVKTDDTADYDNEEENRMLQELIPVIPVEKDEVVDSESTEEKTDREREEQLQAIEKETSEEILNSEFLKYEKQLFENNKMIVGLLDDLILISESNEPDLEMKDRILQEIFPLVENLQTESEKMSFEVISGIYGSLQFCLDLKFKDIVASKENIEVFKLSISGVENLVRGDELKDFDKTIKNLERIQDELNKLLADREDFQKKKYDFGEEESNLIKEFKDSSEYDAYIILRDKITELEETFQIIAGMKDKTYPFESLRKLSVTFALFREIVNIARILEMHKVAYLAEAGYVFVKFVQNYRIDPFKDEVTEVFKYLIYCFKLIYLDKPVKDFDTFVSFLNDPVKIFYHKNKTR